MLAYCLGITSCTVLPSSRRFAAAEAAERDARQLVETGDFESALELIGALRIDGSEDAAYLRATTLGWIHLEQLRTGLSVPGLELETRLAQLRSQTGEAIASLELADSLRPGMRGPLETLASLDEGSGHFDRAIERLESIDASHETSAERALRSLWIGTLRRRAGDLEGALTEMRAIVAATDPGLGAVREDAARAIVHLHASTFPDDPTHWAASLRTDCATFQAAGSSIGIKPLPQVASEGYVVLARGCAAGDLPEEAHAALSAWLDLATRYDFFVPRRLAELPAPENWPDEAGGNAIRELQRALAQGTAETFGPYPFWTSSSNRKRLLTRALRSVAGGRFLAGDPIGAAHLYRWVLNENVAPPVEFYGRDAVLAGESIEVIEITIDLATLLHQEGELTASGALAFGDVVLDLRTGVFEDGIARRVLVEGDAAESMARFHAVLGLIYADRGIWSLEDVGYDAWQAAPLHLREAVRIARDILDRPRPDLALTLARGLEVVATGARRRGEIEYASRMLQGAYENYLEASRGFCVTGDPEYTRRYFYDARDIGRKLRNENLDELRETRQAIGLVVGGWLPRGWIEEGWYVSGGYTLMDAGGDEGRLDSRLGKFGHVVSSDIDDRDSGWNVRVGYQFDSPVAVELGYRTLGSVETQLDVSLANPDVPTLLNDAKPFLPLSGEGVEVNVRANVFGFGPLLFTVNGGIWLWDADVTLQAGNSKVKVREEGLDPHVGIGIITELNYALRLKFEYGLHFIEQEEIHVLGLGLEYSFALR